MKLFLIIPYVIKLMELAEKVFGDGKGETKKELVMEGTAIIVEGFTEESSGGQKNWWDKFGGFIGSIVDNLASILFPHEEKDPVDAAENH